MKKMKQFFFMDALRGSDEKQRREGRRGRLEALLLKKTKDNEKVRGATIGSLD